MARSPEVSRVSLFGAMAIAAVLAAPAMARTITPSDQIKAALNVSKFSLQSIDVPHWQGGDVQVFVQLETGPAVLALHPHSLRSDSFKLLVDDGSGVKPVDAPAPRTFKGDVFQLVGGQTQIGRVRASLLDDGLTSFTDASTARNRSTARSRDRSAPLRALQSRRPPH